MYQKLWEILCNVAKQKNLWQMYKKIEETYQNRWECQKVIMKSCLLILKQLKLKQSKNVAQNVEITKISKTNTKKTMHKCLKNWLKCKWLLINYQKMQHFLKPHYHITNQLKQLKMKKMVELGNICNNSLIPKKMNWLWQYLKLIKYRCMITKLIPASLIILCNSNLIDLWSIMVPWMEMKTRILKFNHKTHLKQKS